MPEKQQPDYLTKSVSDCTNTPCMGRPPKPKHLRRSKRFFLRLTPREMSELEQASRRLEESVAAILRRGGAAYIRSKGKDGSRTKGEKD